MIALFSSGRGRASSYQEACGIALPDLDAFLLMTSLVISGMDFSNPVVINGLALLGVLNVLSTIKVLIQKKIAGGQKLALISITWLIPVLGLVWSEYKFSQIQVFSSHKEEKEEGDIPLSPPTPRYSGYRGSAGRFPRPVPR